MKSYLAIDPSSILMGEIPYRTLGPEQHLFFSPTIFGCTYFVWDVHPRLTKLDLKSLKCILLGYSHVQKGYMCNCFSFNKHFIFFDVMFFEHSSYFSLPSFSLSKSYK